MDSIVSYIEKNFSEKRKIHTEGVRITAMHLAEKYGADVKKAETAALFHDMFRGMPVDIINYYVKHLKLDSKYLNNCNLAHGKIAAIIMEREFDIHDEDVLNAVSYHTTGRAGMSRLEKIIYIADAIEPNRSYPGVDSLREIVEEDLDKACLTSLKRTIDFVKSQGNYLDEDTLRAKEYLEKKETTYGK